MPIQLLQAIQNSDPMSYYQELKLIICETIKKNFDR